MSGYTVAADALRSDAARWRDAADRMNGPRHEVWAMALTKKDMSYAADDHGMVTAYEGVCGRFERIIDQAEVAFNAMERKLLETAAEYERLEHETAHTMNQIRGRL